MTGSAMIAGINNMRNMRKLLSCGCHGCESPKTAVQRFAHVLMLFIDNVIIARLAVIASGSSGDAIETGLATAWSLKIVLIRSIGDCQGHILYMIAYHMM